MITVFLSVMAHGISAAPLADWYAKHVAVLDRREPEIPTPTGRLRSGSAEKAI
jgi:hypothetical protein